MLASTIFMFTPDWKKKDEEHAEWDRKRRSSQEQVGKTRDRHEALYICLHLYIIFLPTFWHTSPTFLVYSIIACSDGRDFQRGATGFQFRGGG